MNFFYDTLLFYCQISNKQTEQVLNFKVVYLKNKAKKPLTIEIWKLLQSF